LPKKDDERQESSMPSNKGGPDTPFVVLEPPSKIKIKN